MTFLARTFVAELASLPLPVWADDADFPDFELAEEAMRLGKILPLAVILERVAALQPGRVIEVELEREEGVHVYEVELITPDGRLLEVDLEAGTGKVLSMDEDN